MSHPKNYIQINGRKYDALTGQAIDDYTPAKTSVDYKPDMASSTTSGNGDQTHKQAQSAHSPRTVAHARPKATQKSTTLMRPAVKKPEIKSAGQKQPRKPELVPPVIKHTPEERLRRAGEVKQSPHIKRFNAVAHQPVLTKKQQPVHVVHQKPAEVHEENVIQEAIHSSVDQFENAIHDATSHLEEYIEEHKPKSYRKLAFATVSLSVILLCGLVAYHAVPAVKVKVAGSKAGFSADLPNYSPAGYGLEGDIAASSGEVTLAYNSRTDNKGYKVHQQPSNWNSQSLVNNFLLAENKPYQTYENNGKTIYIYEETNATWVDGGVWYKIEGDASLTSDQLLRIANSL